MSTKANTAVTATPNRVAERMTSPFVEANLPLVKEAGALTIVPRGNAGAARKAMLEWVEEQLKKENDELLNLAEVALAGRTDVCNALAVHDFFANAPDGVGICVLNAEQPAEAVADVLEELGDA